MGRRTEQLHHSALNYLENKGLLDIPNNYIYEREKGIIIYPETRQLAEEINRSYFFLAAPQCVDNKVMTGDISEVTARFYEAMACKTVIVGIKPKDTFDKLFPYPEAMIEVTGDDFDEKIDQLLKDATKYKRIIEKNYEYVMKYHRWKNRYEELINWINLNDYTQSSGL